VNPSDSRLFSPGRIGPVELKNRIVMPPMTTRLADAGGFVTDDSIAYYMARVNGGTGLITVEMASPEKCGRHRRHEIGIYDDRFLPGLTRLVDEIHRQRRADLLQPAAAEHRDAVGHCHRLALVVGDIDRGGLKTLLQALDLAAHLHAQLGVKVG